MNKNPHKIIKKAISFAVGGLQDGVEIYGRRKFVYHELRNEALSVV